jgi:hypothetical protein
MADGIDNATNTIGGLIGLGIVAGIAGKVFDNKRVRPVRLKAKPFKIKHSRRYK